MEQQPKTRKTIDLGGNFDGSRTTLLPYETIEEGGTEVQVHPEYKKRHQEQREKDFNGKG